MNLVKPGQYRHFKGFVCDVLGVAKHSETQEELVVYKHDGQLWVRPVAMFMETVEREGKLVPRFTYLGKEKLVRDRIPERIMAEGRLPNMRIADVATYRQRLKDKLHEEADEFAEGENAEELADILEVVAAASNAFNIPSEEIERIMAEKREQKGGFEMRLLLKLDEDI